MLTRTCVDVGQHGANCQADAKSDPEDRRVEPEAVRVEKQRYYMEGIGPVSGGGKLSESMQTQVHGG